MLPFRITDSPHIKGTQRRSLWSKQTTNKHMKQPITGAQLQWEGLISKVRKMVWNRLADWDMKAGIVLPTFDTAKFWYWYSIWILNTSLCSQSHFKEWDIRKTHLDWAVPTVQSLQTWWLADWVDGHTNHFHPGNRSSMSGVKPNVTDAFLNLTTRRMCLNLNQSNVIHLDETRGAQGFVRRGLSLCMSHTDTKGKPLTDRCWWVPFASGWEWRTTKRWYQTTWNENTLGKLLFCPVEYGWLT